MVLRQGSFPQGGMCEKTLILLMFLFLSGQAVASELIFSCTTDNGELIKVLKSGDQAQYIFYNKNRT